MKDYKSSARFFEIVSKFSPKTRSNDLANIWLEKIEKILGNVCDNSRLRKI
jgi:hypothetical protein